MPWRALATPPVSAPIEASIALPSGQALVSGPDITRDGTRIAFVSLAGRSEPRIYTRRLDEHALHALDKTTDAHWMTFSPDGRRIGFYARRRAGTARAEAAVGRRHDAQAEGGNKSGHASWRFFVPKRENGPPIEAPSGEITNLLRAWSGGDQAALDRLAEQRNGRARSWPP